MRCRAARPPGSRPSPSGLAAVAAAVASLLLASATPAVSASAATSGATPAPVTEATAAAVAASSGHRVEVTARRTETQQVFANPNGTYTTEITNTPVRVRRGTGWVPIDTTLERRPDGSVGPRAAALDIAFSGGGSAPLAQVGRGGVSLTMGTPFPLPAPVLAGDSATYPEVLPGVDLVMRAMEDSYSQVLVVKTARAAAHPALRTLTFPLRANGAGVRATTEGGVEAVDRFGRVAFASPQPLMWDSSAVTPATAGVAGSVSGLTAPIARSGDTTAQARPERVEGPVEGDAVAAMKVSATATQLQVTPDPALLTGSTTVYPLYIDPTLGTMDSGRTMVSSAYPTQEYWNWTGDEGVGYNNTTGTAMRKRLFFKYRTSGINGSTVLAARFRAFETYAYSCTKTEIQAWRTGDVTSSTNWNNQPSWKAKLASVVTAHGRDGCNPGGASITFDVTAGVKTNVANKATYTTIGLRAGNESSNSGWKRFRKSSTDPVLSIDHNRPPTTPDEIAMANPSKPCGSAFQTTDPPSLKATPRDADGEQVTARFEIWTATGTSVLKTVTFKQTAGQAVTVAIPANSNGSYLNGAGSYRWRVRTEDPVTSSSWSSWCAFSLDASAPPMPTVTLSPTNTYEQGSVISFTLGNGGATDVVSYRWSLNNTALTSTWTPGAATPTATVTRFGPNVLRVQSVDRAGYGSPVNTSEPFVVTWNGYEKNRWRMDERSGTSAADRPANATAPVAANALTLSGPAAFLPVTDGGVWFFMDPTDGALRGGGTATAAGQAVSSATGLVAGRENWSVMAWVRPDASVRRQVVLSQDGTTDRGFSIGIDPVVVPQDDGTTVTQRQFTLTVDNPTGGADVQVRVGDVDAEAGRWYNVAAVYEHPTRTVSLVVIDGESVAWFSNTTQLGWEPAAMTTGKLRVGAELLTSAAKNSWAGDVDEVANFAGALSSGSDDAQLLNYAFRGR